ncbi:MAG: hypothetical protein NTU73_02240 [Ignavibacteriae bacterium]|nr:hypothetical protein [Ignavibacteriota bacterium]
MKKIFITLIFFLAIFVLGDISVFAQSDTTIVKADTIIMKSDITLSPSETYTTELNTTETTLSGTAKMLCARWDLSEYRENGKIQELPNYEIEFLPNGTYNAMEESDYDEGAWILSEDNSKIIFDADTEYREEWTIVSLGDKLIKVKFTSDGNKYEYMFGPYVEWKP